MRFSGENTNFQNNHQHNFSFMLLNLFLSYTVFKDIGLDFKISFDASLYNIDK